MHPKPSPSILSVIQKLRVMLTPKEKAEWGIMVGLALCVSCLEILTSLVVVWFAQILNDPQKGQQVVHWIGFPPLSSGRLIFVTAILVGIMYVTKNLVAMGESFYQNFSIQTMNYRFRSALLTQYAEADYGFHLTRNSSMGIQTIGEDIEQMFSSGMLPMAIIISEGVVFCGLMGMIFCINFSIGLVIAGVGTLLGWVLIHWVLPQFYKLGTILQQSAHHCQHHLLQFFHGFKEILTLGKKEAFIERYCSQFRKKSRMQAIQMACSALPRMVIEILFVGLFVTAIALLCLEQKSPEQMLGLLSGYLYTGLRLMPGLNRIITQLNLVKTVIPSVDHVYEEYRILTENQGYVHSPNFHFHQEIQMRNVNFSYSQGKRVLSDISLSIIKGETLGIIGETGSGKSTLIDLLLGILTPDEGPILVDGKYPVYSHQWHEKIGYVPQSLYLLDDTLEANIAFGEPEIHRGKMDAVLEIALLSSLIRNLSHGTKTILGERGVRLSGGERQRIAIARALYRDPELLIFDEATSALYQETERQLVKNIHEVSRHRTWIMVTHRLSTLSDCHRIVVMENGRVKEIISQSVQLARFGNPPYSERETLGQVLPTAQPL